MVDKYIESTYVMFNTCPFLVIPHNEIHELPEVLSAPPGPPVGDAMLVVDSGLFPISECAGEGEMISSSRVSYTVRNKEYVYHATRWRVCSLATIYHLHSPTRLISLYPSPPSSAAAGYRGVGSHIRMQHVE
jgi:hypothetical protein